MLQTIHGAFEDSVFLLLFDEFTYNVNIMQCSPFSTVYYTIR